MKKIYALLFVIFLVGLVLFFTTSKKKTAYSEFKIISYDLEGKPRQLLVADTPDKWTRGLMNYHSLPGVDGMIFIFPKKEEQSFWNDGTYLDLDLYWLDDDKIVGKSMLPSIEKSHEAVIVNSPKAVNKVIEIVTWQK